MIKSAYSIPHLSIYDNKKYPYKLYCCGIMKTSRKATVKCARL